jgi:hypothetical protein
MVEMGYNFNVVNMKYINRYKDTYTFTLDKDNNILWKGSFKWCRFGMPNDYTKAYNQYLDDECYNDHCMTLEEFKAKLHEHFHNTEHPMRKYVILIETIKNKIDMVDPSGGPYIAVGDKMGSFSEEFKGLVVSDIESIDGGYKLITAKGE